MKLPDKDFKIKVGPFEYDVIYSADVTEEGDCFGSCHSDTQRIYLKPGMKKQKTEHTLLHELLHACNFINGIVFDMDGEGKEKVTEERVVRDISMVFYQVMKDNPNIFEK